MYVIPWPKVPKNQLSFLILLKLNTKIYNSKFYRNDPLPMMSNKTANHLGCVCGAQLSVEELSVGEPGSGSQHQWVPGSGVNRGNIRWWLSWALHDPVIQPRLSALSKILSYNQRVCYSPFYWWQPLIQETVRGQLHSAKLGHQSTRSGHKTNFPFLLFRQQTGD